ncbi:MAG: SagB/ThcOx family dehydrogenase, partial [Desulfobulbaceae bacterium]|nr:SagB/ThcOx family dehydrogenase [Desulfobulbaceae bacterium]
SLLFSKPPAWTAEPELITLPQPRFDRGLPLMQAIQHRQSSRLFSKKNLPEQTMSDLLWAAYGINRPKSGKRTAPSAHDRQEIDLYVATANGLYLYQAKGHGLNQITAGDIRKLTSRQKFPGQAPLNLIYVVNFSRMKGVPRENALEAAAIATGAIVQNVYLYCASEGLAVVARGSLDRKKLAAVMGLGDDQHIILAQTVGYPAQ